MKIIIGQGNPGSQYQHTRHNAGWTILQAYASAHTAQFVKKTKFFADIAEVSLHGEKVLLVLPSTFYNEVGKSARALLDFYKVDSSDVLVIHDDIALPQGSLRIRNSGSDAGNNGIKSFNAHIGPDYWRIRIGIQPAHPVSSTSDYVLGAFTAREREIFKLVLPEVISQLEAFVRGSIAAHSVTVVDHHSDSPA